MYGRCVHFMDQNLFSAREASSLEQANVSEWANGWASGPVLYAPTSKSSDSLSNSPTNFLPFTTNGFSTTSLSAVSQTPDPYQRVRNVAIRKYHIIYRRKVKRLPVCAKMSNARCNRMIAKLYQEKVMEVYKGNEKILNNICLVFIVTHHVDSI